MSKTHYRAQLVASFLPNPIKQACMNPRAIIITKCIFRSGLSKLRSVSRNNLAHERRQNNTIRPANTTNSNINRPAKTEQRPRCGPHDKKLGDPC